MSEFTNVNKLADNTNYSKGVMESSIEYFFKIIQRYFKGNFKVLEIGPAEGVMTKLLAECYCDLTIVEPVTKFCQNIQEKFPGVKVHNCLIEDFAPKETFDLIILGHVLEHVDEPVDILKKLRKSLSATGKIVCSVPNACSLHRQAAVLMNILENEKTLNESDIKHGHRRVFDPTSFREVFKTAGYELNFSGGYWLKVLSNNQIEQMYTKDMIDSYMMIGERYPDIAAEIYVIASIE